MSRWRTTIYISHAGPRSLVNVNINSEDTCGTGWDRLAVAGGFFPVFPTDGLGKGSPLFTAGWEWDGNVGSHLVDKTGWESAIYWWDGTGRDEGAGREIG